MSRKKGHSAEFQCEKCHFLSRNSAESGKNRHIPQSFSVFLGGHKVISGVGKKRGEGIL